MTKIVFALALTIAALATVPASARRTWDTAAPAASAAVVDVPAHVPEKWEPVFR